MQLLSLVTAAVDIFLNKSFHASEWVLPYHTEFMQTETQLYWEYWHNWRRNFSFNAILSVQAQWPKNLGGQTATTTVITGQTFSLHLLFFGILPTRSWLSLSPPHTPLSWFHASGKSCSCPQTCGGFSLPREDDTGSRLRWGAPCDTLPVEISVREGNCWTKDRLTTANIMQRTRASFHTILTKAGPNKNA